MGNPIAIRLLSSGVSLVVWNRTPTKSHALVAHGAAVASTPADAATQVVLTVLPDLPQVEDLVMRDDGLLRGWHERGIEEPILVIHGTTSPVATADFSQRLRDHHGIRVIDAPLSGGTVGAAAGTLSIMIGGDEPTATEIEPIFQPYGKVIRYFGAPGSGALAKACNQIVVAATVAAISESLSLASRAGLSRATVIEILEGGLAGSEVLRQKKAKWLADEYEEGGSAFNQLKDLRFVDEAAHSLNLELPVGDAVRGLFERMIANGDGELDHTGVIRTVQAGGER
jgi:3-hydroxyisobutyrate dehydrogenase-like beta-hydroxyacid dehydrogenase